MISKGMVSLFTKQKNLVRISVELRTNGKIKTNWSLKIPRNTQQLLKILHTLKINGCAICGYDKCIAALEFHHVNPKDKKFSVRYSEISRKDDSIAEEINKCILLCSNCHREMHFYNKVVM